MTQGYTTYEDIAYRFFDDCKRHFGFEVVERRVQLCGKSGNKYRIEVLGRRGDDGSASVIIECKYYGANTHVTQEDVGGLAFRVEHTGASEAFIVTTKELQPGAQKVAAYEGIAVFVIEHGATLDDYGVVRQIADGFQGLFLRDYARVSLREAVAIDVFEEGPDGARKLVQTRRTSG